MTEKYSINLRINFLSPVENSSDVLVAGASNHRYFDISAISPVLAIQGLREQIKDETALISGIKLDPSLPFIVECISGNNIEVRMDQYPL